MSGSPQGSLLTLLLAVETHAKGGGDGGRRDTPRTALHCLARRLSEEQSWQGRLLTALLLQALMGLVELVTIVVVLLENVRHIRGGAMQMHVVTADGLNHLREGPHADAPRVPGVRPRAHLPVPLEGSLPGDLPEVAALAPVERRTAAVLEELR